VAIDPTLVVIVTVAVVELAPLSVTEEGEMEQSPAGGAPLQANMTA
jgi:hypothetical protein